MKERFTHIAEKWFFTEQTLFAVYCMFKLKRNNTMDCELRTGVGFIEYNSQKLEKVTDLELEEHLRLEVIRILLKHPYERQPTLCNQGVLSYASDMVLSDNYTTKYVKLVTSADYKLPCNECFEWYVKELSLFPIPPFGTGGQGLSKGKGQGQGQGQNQAEGQAESQGQSQNQAEKAAHAHAALWEENELECYAINQLISEIQSWGSIPGKMVELIKASLIVKMDYKKILSGFRQSTISSKRRLARMRPNRRSGFEHLGSLYAFTTKLLVAVDVSGSISSESVTAFYSIINRFFKYGIKIIDVMQFDCEVRKVQSLKKAQKDVIITGRGGTNFQIVFDHIQKNNKYDGLIIFTDGYADIPTKKNTGLKVLWICTDEETYNAHKSWMHILGRSCYINL